jgi:hypothetical protein
VHNEEEKETRHNNMLDGNISNYLTEAIPVLALGMGVKKRDKKA